MSEKFSSGMINPKQRTKHMNKLELGSPFPHYIPSGSGEEDENVKSLRQRRQRQRQRRRTTDKF